VVDHAELLQRMGESPALARSAGLATGPRPAVTAGGWPPQVVLGHLAYVERTVWLPRLHEMTDGDGSQVPVWQWWEPDGVDWSGLYGGRDCADVAEEFELERNATLAYLGALPDSSWARRGRHAVFGELAVAGLCEEVLAHDHNHLAQLRE
jgi:DinB superfamily